MENPGDPLVLAKPQALIPLRRTSTSTGPRTCARCSAKLRM